MLARWKSQSFVTSHPFACAVHYNQGTNPAQTQKDMSTQGCEFQEGDDWGNLRHWPAADTLYNNPLYSLVSKSRNWSKWKKYYMVTTVTKGIFSFHGPSSWYYDLVQR